MLTPKERADWRFKVLRLFAVWHFVVISFRQLREDHPSRWLHDRPAWFVNFICVCPEPDSSLVWARALYAQADRERNFRLACGGRK